MSGFDINSSNIGLWIAVGAVLTSLKSRSGPFSPPIDRDLIDDSITAVVRGTVQTSGYPTPVLDNQLTDNQHVSDVPMVTVQTADQAVKDSIQPRSFEPASGQTLFVGPATHGPLLGRAHGARDVIGMTALAPRFHGRGAGTDAAVFTAAKDAHDRRHA